MQRQFFDGGTLYCVYKQSLDPLNVGVAVLKGSGKIHLGPLEFMSLRYPCKYTPTVPILG